MPPAEFSTTPLDAISGTAAKPVDTTVPCSFWICGPGGRELYFSDPDPGFTGAVGEEPGTSLWRLTISSGNRSATSSSRPSRLPGATLGQAEAN